MENSFFELQNFSLDQCNNKRKFILDDEKSCNESILKFQKLQFGISINHLLISLPYNAKLRIVTNGTIIILSYKSDIHNTYYSITIYNTSEILTCFSKEHVNWNIFIL